MLNNETINERLKSLNPTSDGSNLIVDGDIQPSGDLTVSGTATITGNTAITGTLAVTGKTTLNEADLNKLLVNIKHKMEAQEVSAE